MFEKEAEEIGNEKIKGNFQLARCARKSYKDGFKDGAEFGYNKAKEWHDPKKQLPKQNGEVLIEYGSCNAHSVVDWISDLHKFGAWDIEEVHRWKEIE